MTDSQGPWDKEKAERHAGWARMMSRLIYAPFARKIAASLSPTLNEPVLVDLGTGPGVLAIEVHKLLPHARVIGIDLSAVMLEIAKGNAVKSGMTNFEGRIGNADEIPVETGSVDLVFSQFSLHEWEDAEKGLSEVHRILKCGGSVMLRDFNRVWFTGWKRGLVKFLSAVVGESYEDHLEMFRYSFDDVAGLLKEVGFAEIKGKAGGLVLLIQGSR